MPENSKPAGDGEPEPVAPTPPQAEEDQNNDAGDFITRQVLEKDTVFFEG